MSEKTSRILLIEDSLADARLVRENLTDATQTDLDIPDVDIVRTVKLSTGLKRLSKGDIDLVLLDLSLPDSQGLDTFIQIHSQAPEVPVVILSDPEDKAQAVEAVRKGARDYLVKGQTSSALLLRSIHYAIKCARAEAIRQRTEEALRESEANLKQTQRIAHLGSWELNLENNKFTVSKEIVRIYKYEDRYTGPVNVEEFASYIHPDDRETVLSALNDAIAGTAPYDLEFRIVRTDGKVRILHTQGEVTRDESGKPIRMIGTGLDITERKRAEEALRYRVEFEGLITDISTHFINLSSEEVDDGINRALQIIGEFTDVDRSYVFLFQESGATMDNTHEWCAQGIEPQIQELKGTPTDVFQWSLERIRRSEVVHIPCVADLPSEASAEKEEFQAEGIHSLIMVPIVYGGKALGFLGLDSVQAEREWAEDIIALLRIVGEIFANALERKKAEAALRESEERYRQLFELESDALFLIDNESSSILEANAAASALYGYSHEELLAKRNTDLSAEPEDTQKVTRTTPIANQVVTIPLRFHRKKDGTVFPVEITGRFFDKQGRSVHIAAIRDITERKRAEEALRENEELLDSILAASAIGIAYARNRKIIWANDAMAKLFGFTEERQYVGKDTKMLYASEEEHRRVGEIAYEQQRSGSLIEFDAEFRHQDGSLFDGHVKINTLDPLNPMRGVIVSIIDITERKQTEEERERLLAQVREQAERVQQIIDTVPEGVVLLDTDSSISLANPLGRENLRVLADTLVGGTLTRLGDHPLPTILTSPPQGLWHEVTAEERVFQVIARPIEIGPTPKGWVLVIHEVTRQREIERRAQQQERLAAVGQLAAGIAHDFNNIMAVITLYAGMALRTSDLPAKVGERLEIIDQQARRASDLIQQILDFSRRAVLERRPMELKAFLKEQVKLLERTLPENIQIDLSVGEDEYMVNADPTRVQQAIMNLATNARDAMSEGGQLRIDLVKVQVTERKSASLPDMEPGEWVRVTVADTGTGIPPDVLPHIYDPFFTTKPVGMGTGLGLSQVYGIVKQHEGQIDVATQEGKGTTFTIYLPAMPQRPEPPHYEAEALVQGQGQTILVVEDDDATRAALVDSLELLDYRVVETINGQEALSILEQYAGRSPADPDQEIALVLSDVVMPGLDGRALFHTLKERDLATKVVLLTGHPLDERELEGLRSKGLGGWLLKPLSIERLSQVIAEALEEE